MYRRQAWRQRGIFYQNYPRAFQQGHALLCHPQFGDAYRFLFAWNISGTPANFCSPTSLRRDLIALSTLWIAKM